MPAFLFPNNRQATGMNHTLCQGALKPPEASQSAAPSLVTWSRPKWALGNVRCPLVLLAARRVEPHEVLAEGPHSLPRVAHPCFRASAAQAEARRGGVLALREIAAQHPAPSLRPLKKGPLSQRREPLHLSPVSLVSGGGQKCEYREGAEAQGRASVRLLCPGHWG